MVQTTLETRGMDPRRFELDWVSAAEAARFADIVTKFVDKIRQLGPNPLGTATQEHLAPHTGRESQNGR